MSGFLICCGSSLPISSFAATSALDPSIQQLPKVPADGEMGFVFTDFTPAVYPGMADACPTGYAHNVKENFLDTVAPAERARLLKPENEEELTERYHAYGIFPDNTNICTNYDMYRHPLYKTVQSKISYGVNLDADTSGNPDDPYVCPHRNFVSPTGEKGVDNQMYRAVGCDRQWRGPDGNIGDIGPGYKGWVATGEYTIVVVLRNVHSLVSDDGVEVILASSTTKPIVDTRQNFIRDASYHVAENPRWRTVLHGHIHNGVLTTDSKDVVLARPIGLGGDKGLKQEWNFARSRLELAFKPDGTLDGVLGGYVPLTTFMYHQIYGGALNVTNAGTDCSSQYWTIKVLADGDRDSKTGQCNRISAAMHVEATPAFIFDEARALAKSAAAADAIPETSSGHE